MRPAIILGLSPFLALALFGQSSNVLVRQAEEDLSAGQFSRAEQELSRAVAAEPASWNLWCELGEARVQLGETGPAIEAFEKARRLAPQQAAPEFGLGSAYVKKGDAAKALEAYRAGLARDPNDVAANQTYAYLLIQKDDFRDAVEPLRRLEDLEPGNVPARASLIEAYFRGGMKDQGEQEIDRLLSAHVATMPQEISLARMLLAGGEGNAAVQVFRHASATWPDAAEPHGELGLLLMKAGQYQAAVAELGTAAQIDPGSAQYALGLGEALLRWRHERVALQYLLAVQSKFGEHPLYKFELGLAYYYLTRYPEALQQFQVLSQEQPKSSQIAYLLGGSYKVLGNLDKAEECFRKAIALKPDEPSYYIALAALLRRVDQADLTESVTLAEKALTLSPHNEDAKLLLASLYQAQGKLPEAQALLEGVIAGDPNFRAAHQALAQVYFRQKRVDDAERQQSIAAKLEERSQNEASPWEPGGAGLP